MLLKKKRKQNPKWKKIPQKNKNYEQTQPSLLISILYLYLKFH